MEKLGYSVEDAAPILGVGRTTIFELIADWPARERQDRSPPHHPGGMPCSVSSMSFASITAVSPPDDQTEKAALEGRLPSSRRRRLPQ